MSNLPPKLQEIVDDFAGMTREEKLETLIAYAESFPPLPERYKKLRDDMESVPECMTPVFLIAEKDSDDKIAFHFDIPPESPTVRGYAAILGEGLHGIPPEQVVSIPTDFYLQMGLHKVLSQQRLRGITALLAYLKRLAREKLANS